MSELAGLFHAVMLSLSMVVVGGSTGGTGVGHR